MKNIIVFIVAMTLSFMSFAQSLEGNKWQLQQLKGFSQLPQSFDKTTVSVVIEFNGKKAAGNDGCNQIFVNYIQKSQQLRITGPIGSTRMACIADEVNKFANAYQQALKNVSSFKIEKDILTLFDKKKKTLLVYHTTK